MSRCPNCGDLALERNDESAFHAAVYKLAATMRAHVPPALCEPCLEKQRERIEGELRDEMNSDASLWRLYLGGRMTETQLLANVAHRAQYAELIRKRNERRQASTQAPTRTRRTDSAAGFGDDE